MNKTEHEHKDRKIISRTGLVKLSRLRNTLDSQSNTRLDWIMFHKIDEIYRKMKHKDTLQASLAIQNLKSPFFNSPLYKYQPSELSLPVNLQEVPPDLQDIQPISSQIWNFGEILFYLNIICCNMV